MKRSSQRIMSVRRLAAAVAALSLVVVACGPAEDAPLAAREGTPSPSPDPDGVGLVCPLPEFRPGWLPWLAEGEPVPEPDETWHDPESSGFDWLGDDEAEAWHGPVVSLSRSPHPDVEPGTDDNFRPVEVRGHAGELRWVGDPGIGELAVWWREADGACGVYRLGVLTSGGWEPYLGSPFQEGERCAPYTQLDEDFEYCYEQFVDAMETIIVEVAQSLIEG